MNARAPSLLAVWTATAALAAQDGAPPTFEGDVLPLLQRQGCASAYCHGSATGRGGFKLSLFGGDPAADHLAIAAAGGGRRLDLAAPERSLLLRKPSLDLVHQGGRRLPAGGEAYARMREWIAVGAPRGDAAAVRELRLRLDGDRLIATATTTDGARRDVTALVVFESLAPGVAEVDDRGVVRWTGPGIAAFTARYAGRDALLQHLRPLPEPVPAEGVDPAHPIDRAMTPFLQELGLRMGPPAPPERLARRLHLDLVGRPPRPEELQAFLAAPPQQALAAAADRLLASPEFVAHFARHVQTWLELPEPRRAELWLAGEARVAAWLPELLRTGGTLLERHGDPRDRAEFVARAMLGAQLGCARCHDHPNDRWRRTDHLAFAAALATRQVDGISMRSELVDDDGRAVAPRLLGCDDVLDGDPGARLAAQLAAPGSALARNFANRVLHWLLGRAPVEPVDDHRLGNPAAAPPLLDAVVAEFDRTGGDLRALLRFVIASAVYTADSEPWPDADRDHLAQRHFARRTSYPLPHDRLLAACARLFGGRAPAAGTAPTPLQQQLALQNGPFLRELSALPGNPVDAIADLVADPDAGVHEMFLLILSRPPRGHELTALQPMLTGDRRTALRDLAHALLRSREFGAMR